MCSHFSATVEVLRKLKEGHYDQSLVVHSKPRGRKDTLLCKYPLVYAFMDVEGVSFIKAIAKRLVIDREPASKERARLYCICKRVEAAPDALSCAKCLDHFCRECVRDSPPRGRQKYVCGFCKAEDSETPRVEWNITRPYKRSKGRPP